MDFIAFHAAVHSINEQKPQNCAARYVLFLLLFCYDWRFSIHSCRGQSNFDNNENNNNVFLIAIFRFNCGLWIDKRKGKIFLIVIRISCQRDWITHKYIWLWLWHCSCNLIFVRAMWWTPVGYAHSRFDQFSRIFCVCLRVENAFYLWRLR